MMALVRPVPLTGSDQPVSATPAIYRGFTVRETAGATAVVRIFDHASAASGTVLEEITLAANGSARELYGAGLLTTNGIYVQIVSGAVSGSIRIG
ncbi:hypothetical protein Ssi03_62610 [Sphaerisporangium siamense]|uniref:Uncharacterized protein n=1 Tax=Sphaerisporangium siamense TaxID=795645 RepID=A0A7W7D955_9ACTN|nr:hypothetical protein [Sphaerisporangium siamense]MBB4702569.1 hypothetical protein [Sphaerisporangium siamense]GII88271.1 hypothetical protein Ssi03_62610 [Sphaerisporangium siamense]